MTVYVVTSGDYSDYGIEAIFSTQEKAAAYAEALMDANGVEEYDLDDYHPVKPGWDIYYVGMRRNGDTDNVAIAGEHSYTRGFVQGVGEPDYGLQHPYRGAGTGVILDGAILHGYVYAKSEEHAVKIVNEHRIQMIASGEWPIREVA